MQKLLKPKALKQGDKVASVSLSWGGASVFRAFYQKAKKQFETTFDVHLVEMPPASQLLYFLRNLGAQGILDKVQGILFARPGGDFAPDQQQEQAQWLAHFGDYDKAILQALAEFGQSDMPVVTHMDFGHTVPQNILPYGALCEIDPVQKRVAILESAVA